MFALKASEAGNHGSERSAAARITAQQHDVVAVIDVPGAPDQVCQVGSGIDNNQGSTAMQCPPTPDGWRMLHGDAVASRSIHTSMPRRSQMRISRFEGDVHVAERFSVNLQHLRGPCSGHVQLAFTKSA